MSCLGEIVEISRIGAEELSVEWQIRDFLSLPGDIEQYYYSPEFKLGDESWSLSIWPYWADETTNSATGWVALDIQRCDEGRAKTFRVSVGLKGTSEVEDRNGIIEKEFSDYDYYHLWQDFYVRDYLIEDKSTLMPDGILKVRCVLKCVASLTEDASTQTYSHEVLTEVKKSSEKRGQQSCEECVICYEKAVDCVLYRCGHMCMCYNCAFKLRTSNLSAQCPICRNSIQDVIKIYK